MFRYIALAWEPSNPACPTAVEQFSRNIRVHPDWRQASGGPGLRVFVAGDSDNINSAHALPRDQGVVLGTLFRRRDPDEPAPDEVSLTADDADRILRSRGRHLVECFWGRYVALMHESNSGGACVVRDPTGALPCYLMRHRGVWVIFSWIEDLLALAPALPALTVNWDYIAVHVPALALECRETAINGVTQVFAGEAVHICNDTRTSEFHWNAVEIAQAGRDEDRAGAAAALRRTVRACTRAWASRYGDVLLRLSGGIDSSIVLSCLAADSTTVRVTCVNYHSAGSDSDERAYARLAAAKAQRTLVECERDPNVRLEHILDIARTPNPSFYLGRMEAWRLEAELSKAHRVSGLFTGVGGDQVFFQKPTFWPVADYMQTNGFDTGLLASAMDAARLGRVSVWKALAFAMRRRLSPLPVDPNRQVGAYATLVKPDVVAAARRNRRFMHPVLNAATNTPIGKLSQIRTLLFPPEYYDPVGLGSTPERVHPLLSQPVVELCLRLPTYLLINGGRDRALARQAFASDLPPEIARRRSKGGQEEHVRTILLRNLEFMRSMLLDGALVRQGILDRTKLEVVLSHRPTAIASSLMDLHTYVGIEAWLNRWSTSDQRAAA